MVKFQLAWVCKDDSMQEAPVFSRVSSRVLEKTAGVCFDKTTPIFLFSHYNQISIQCQGLNELDKTGGFWNNEDT